MTVWPGFPYPEKRSKEQRQSRGKPRSAARRKNIKQARQEDINIISTQETLDAIVSSGWTVVGPRHDTEKDLRYAKNFLKRGIAFYPEHVLEADGFRIVPPNPLTRGHQLMYKDEGQLMRYTRSQYKLVCGQTEVSLYVFLKEENTSL